MGLAKQTAPAVSVSRRLSANYNLEKPALAGEYRESAFAEWLASAARFDRYGTERRMTGWEAFVAMLATIGLGIAIVHCASELFRWYFAQA